MERTRGLLDEGHGIRSDPSSVGLLRGVCERPRRARFMVLCEVDMALRLNFKGQVFHTLYKRIRNSTG